MNTKDTCIAYAIWLQLTCSLGANHYVYKSRIYYTDMSSHMEGLYNEFLKSEYYKNYK